MKTNTEYRRFRIIKIVFFIMLIILIFEIGLISSRKNNSKIKYKNYITLSDSELTANLIKTKYIYDTSYTEEELANYSPKEQLKLLNDEYSHYLTEEEYKEIINNRDFKYVGLGFQSITVRKEYLEIKEILPNSPVEESGLKKGDKIFTIDGKAIKDIPYSELQSLILNQEIKDSIFRIKRDNNIFDICITRRLIKGNPVQSKMLNEEIGYMKISVFSSDLGVEFITELNNLIGENMKKLIIDLRGNPGGDMDQITPIVSALLDNSIVYFFDIKYKDNNIIRYTREQNNIFSGPIVVLCDEDTASASEALICILKDYNRCTTVGKKTLGKQITQEYIFLNSRNVLILSTGKVITPMKKNYHKIGIKPDIDKSLNKQNQDVQIKTALEILNKKTPDRSL